MSKWALILGASTGHGGATAISLAEKVTEYLVFILIEVRQKKRQKKQFPK